VVSGNVGCVAGKTIQQFLNFVYFADQFGRPWRMSVGGTPEPIWLQAREVFEDTAAQITDSAWATIEPNLNLYLLKAIGTNNTHMVWEARSGAYFGYWTLDGGGNIATGGRVFNATGQRCVLILQSASVASDPIEFRRLTLTTEGTWTDTGSAFATVLQTHYQGYALDETLTPTAVMAAAEVGNAAGVIAATGTLYTMNGNSSLPSFTPQSLASGVDGVGAYVWQVANSRSGRGVRVQLSFTPTTNQVKLYRIAIDAMVERSSVYDR